MSKKDKKIEKLERKIANLETALASANRMKDFFRDDAHENFSKFVDAHMETKKVIEITAAILKEMQG